jgi:arylsulfatase
LYTVAHKNETICFIYFPILGAKQQNRKDLTVSSFTRRQFIGKGAAASLALLGSRFSAAENAPRGPAGAASRRPNIILIIADDMGYSDVGCYGSEIETPNIDSLAKGGLRFTQFYNCARCCPTRASLLTGLYPHQAGIGLMGEDLGTPGYRGDLSDQCVTIAEALKETGYHTLMSGKWNVTPEALDSNHNWPLQRGFERFFGTIGGAGSYFDPITLTRDNTPIRAAGENFYYTDAISKNASQFIADYAGKQAPFFLYVAYTAPHWPLHALEKDINKHKHQYEAGWDVIRRERHRRMISQGIVDEAWPISPRDPRVPPWEVAHYQDWEAQRMAVYAAQISSMDQGIGRILSWVRQQGIEEDTLILFLSDNGGNSEELSPGVHGWFVPNQTRDGRLVRSGNSPTIMPGGEDTYLSYGIPWGNVSNTPFRMYKHFAHEGGIATPLIAYWPGVIQGGNRLTHQVGHVMDIMATCLDAAGATYPKTYRNREIVPLEGKSLVPIFTGQSRKGHDVICWEHEGNSAIRQGKWKMVSGYSDYWELHDMETDRTELQNLADTNASKIRELAAIYQRWADRVGVRPWPVPGASAYEERTPVYLRR